MLGGIDLDPCSDTLVNPNVSALHHYIEGGLEKPWHGRVFMNPPYGRDIKQWIAKVVTEYESGRCTEAIVLVHARTDTQWFQMINRFPFCLVRGRLKFSGSKNNAPFPSAIFYLGTNLSLFARYFRKHGDIYQKV